MERSRDERDDDELVEAARGGDSRSFAILLHRHEGRVLRVLRLLGVASDDREDVAQEVFVRVFRFLDGYRPGQSFSGWLYRIAANAAHDQRSRAGRRPPEDRRRSSGAPEPGPVDPRPDPDRRLRSRELRQALERALGSLSDRERAAFVLVELEGLTAREVGRALGITSITVRRHLGRARRHLQAVLADEKNSGSD